MFSGICDRLAWRKVRRPLGSGSMPVTPGVGPSWSPDWRPFWTISRLNRNIRSWGPASARSSAGSTVSSYIESPSSFLRELFRGHVNLPRSDVTLRFSSRQTITSPSDLHSPRYWGTWRACDIIKKKNIERKYESEMKIESWFGLKNITHWENFETRNLLRQIYFW